MDAGVPAEKLVMGVPFYGHVYSGVVNINNGLYQRFQACGTVSAIEAELLLGNQGYDRFWHPQSAAPWLFDGSTFISYDDAQSLEQKANFVKENSLGGVMIWEISLDPNQYLLDVLLRGLQGKSGL
jgi:chitinase